MVIDAVKSGFFTIFALAAIVRAEAGGIILADAAVEDGTTDGLANT